MEKSERVASSLDTIMSRRNFMKFCGGAVLLGIMASDTYIPELLHLHSREYVVLQAPRKAEKKLSLEEIDTVYLSNLLRTLSDAEGSPESRVRAVRGALRTIRQYNGPTESAVIGTALQIDESGIYLTANHVALYSTSEVLGQYDLAVNDPLSGEVYGVAGVVKHAQADIAVLYAPTGKPRAVTPGIVFDPVTPSNGQRLGLIGYFPDKNQASNGLLYGVDHQGSVDASVHIETIPHPYQYFPEFYWDSASMIAIKGLIPYGGTSGSPIVDMSGRIVGVETGAYPNSNLIKDYIGARITLISYALGLPNQRALLYGS